MVLYTPNLELPEIEPDDTPVTYPVVQNELAVKVDAECVRLDAEVLALVTVSLVAPPTSPPPARDGLLWVQVV